MKKAIIFLKRSLVKSLVASVIFLLISLFYNYEIVRSNVSDPAFTAINYVSSLIKSNDNHNSSLKVYHIDKGYFAKNNLLNDFNETNYGAIFPRSKIAEFIKTIDKLSPQKQPLAFFIDYDLTDGSATYDSNSSFHISKDDMVLLKQLAKDRNYTILLPRIFAVTFIEKYAKFKDTNTSKSIKNKILNKQIIFVDVNFLESTYIYRFLPLEKKYDIFTNKKRVYHNVSLVSWQLIKNGKVDNNKLNKLYPPKDFKLKKVIENGKAVLKSNILYKEKQKAKTQKIDSIDLSNWKGLMYQSAQALLDKNLSYNKKTILLLGVDYKGRDNHTDPFGDVKNGVDIHANSIKTALFLDGKLKYINIFEGFILVFILFLIFSAISEYIIYKAPLKLKIFIERVLFFAIYIIVVGNIYNLAKSNIYITATTAILLGAVLFYIYTKVKNTLFINMVIEVSILTTIMFAISLYLLLEQKIWFNWFVPILIFYIDDLFIVMSKYRKSS